MRTTILIADDHALFRQGLRHLIAREPDLELVAEAGDGQEALDQLRQHPADLVLVDAVMPVLNGIELVRKINIEFPGTRSLMVSGHIQARFVCEALEAGAVGYVTKSSAVTHLLEAIRAATHGRTYLSPCIADVVVQQYVRSNGHNGNGNGNGHGHGNGNGNGHANGNGRGRHTNGHGRSLTPREREVLQMLSEGHATKQIASRLCVSVKTIDTHRAAVMRKLELPSIAHLTKYAVREGITTLDY